MPVSLCKDCKWRHRRAFMPLDPSEYNDNTIIIMLQCLVTELDIADEITIDCTHYERKQ